MKPFLSGVFGGAAVITSLLIAAHSVPALGDGDWEWFTFQFLWAVCIGAIGLSFLLTVLEIDK